MAMLALVVTVTEGGGAQQPTTAEGVAAIGQGDYARAAAILKPLAEIAPTPDHVAQFYLALLYESGRGVGFDPVRACALYLRSMGGGNPFSEQARVLASAIQARVTPRMADTCLKMATGGFNDALDPPITFTLAPGHWVEVSRTGVTIQYAGKQRHEMMMFGANAIMLAPRLTELATGPDRSTRRHYLEFFAWHGGTADSKTVWSLGWNVFEVVRDHLEIAFGSGSVAMIEAPEPPPVFDVSRAVRLGVNAAGEVEWEIVGGPRSQKGIHPVPETPEQKAARQARTQRVPKVEVTDPLDPLRPPAMVYPNVNGCASVFVYGWSADWTEALTIQANKDRLQLSTEPRVFDLAQTSPDLTISIHVYAAPFHHDPFCTDVVVTPPDDQTWRAHAGRITIQLSPPGILRDSPHMYRVTVRIDDAEFVSPSGARVRLRAPLVFTAIAGGVVG